MVDEWRKMYVHIIFFSFLIICLDICVALVLVSDDLLSYRSRLPTHSPAGVLLTSQSYPCYKNSTRLRRLT